MGWRGEGATWQSAEVATVEYPVTGTFLPKGGSQRGPVTAKRMGAVRDEFSSWHKSYFLNNSSLNTAVSSRYLKPWTWVVFQSLACKWLLASKQFSFFFGFSMRGLERSFSFTIETPRSQSTAECAFQTILSPAGAAESPRHRCSQLPCTCRWVENTRLLFVQSTNVYWVWVCAVAANDHKMGGCYLFSLFTHVYPLIILEARSSKCLLGLKSKFFLEALGENPLPCPF